MLSITIISLSFKGDQYHCTKTKTSRDHANLLKSHWFWVLYSQRSSHKANRLHLWTSIALARYTSSRGEGIQREQWAGHPSGQLGQLGDSEAWWWQRCTLHSIWWLSECPPSVSYTVTHKWTQYAFSIVYSPLFFSLWWSLLRSLSLLLVLE